MVRKASLNTSARACAFALCLAVAPTVSQAATEKVIYAFKGLTNGSEPTSALIRVGGKFYGTTYGRSEYGTVFFVQADGRHRVLYNFMGGADGTHPYGGLVQFNGVLYGTTVGGGGTGCGGYGCGTIYSITPQGDYAQMYAFQGGTDGSLPSSTLIVLNGLLYGSAGGGANGKGTVFSVTPQGALTTLYAFRGSSDGSEPQSLITDGTKLFGNANGDGGTKCQSNGCGTVFGIDLDGNETTLHSFGNGRNGGNPISSLLLLGDQLYGTTNDGGTGPFESSKGVVFSVSLSGEYKLLHAFDGADGGTPYAGLIALGGILYGTTSGFGPNNNGTVFSVSPTGDKFTTLYSFLGGTDGSSPVGNLLSFDGVLYGTTAYGGDTRAGSCKPSACGTVFSITP